MRIWSLHPKYLDVKGLLAGWREALLAKKVLEGKTKGYTRHPQLLRFQRTDAPLAFINAYLQTIYEESLARGYRFDGSKIDKPLAASTIPVHSEQVDYEFALLKTKLRIRDEARYRELEKVKAIEVNPLFKVVPGAIEEWERVLSLGE